MRKLSRQRCVLYAGMLGICGMACILLSKSFTQQNITILPSINLHQSVFQYGKRGVDSDIEAAKDNIVPRVEGASNALTPSHKGVDMVSFERALRAHSSPDWWITLALADQGCLDMAISFYETSLRAFGINNYLIIASDNETCTVLARYQINCYVYVADKDSGHASVYHSKDFLRKMNIRTYMILDALRLGYNVLHTDLDIFFMKNPFVAFNYRNVSYDLAPLYDWTKHNAGFLFIRATLPSIQVYQASAHIANTEAKTDDQIALNRAIKTVEENEKIVVQKLSPAEYQCGKKYWEEGKRNFVEDQECSACVVVHNNWIVSMEAKRYRFREIGMWRADIGAYYSDKKAKYLMYDNEVIIYDAKKEDLKSLENALAIGEILNRTVILPKFHCTGKRCTILDHILLRTFEKYFPNYREHTFLQNPLVPKDVRNSISNRLVITSDKYVEVSKRDKRPEETDVQMYQPMSAKKGATSEEILTWFGDMHDSVLRFDNLVGVFCCFTDNKKQKTFKNKIKLGFEPGKYKQQK